MIDDKRNDIYLHIDKKAGAISKNEFATHNANLYLLKERFNIGWGAFSLIKATLRLFETATSKGAENYSYCHLISGIDLPIKSQDYIHDFFEQNEGKEFVGFTCDKFDDDDLKWKTRYYHVLCQYQRNPNFILRKTTRLVHHLFIRLQKLFHFTRQQDIEFRKGCNWCSLSNKFVKYLVDNKQIVYERFNHMFCADEIFIQTMLWNSAFKDNI